MHNQTMTADMIIPAMLQDIAKPTFEGFYDLTFVSDNPFLVHPDLTLYIYIDKDGSPKLKFPEGVTTHDGFTKKLESHLYSAPDVFRPNSWCALIQRSADGKTLNAWGWGIETNGHLTPKQYEEEGETFLKPGWTINHTPEVFQSLVECMRLLQTTAERAIAANLSTFAVTMLIDGSAVEVKARQNEQGDDFSLDREDYPEAFLSFKNASYVAQEATVIVTLDQQNYTWVPQNGILLPEKTSQGSRGWDIDITDEEASELMDILTLDLDEMDVEEVGEGEERKATKLKPSPRNLMATSSQQVFLDRILSNLDGTNHLVAFFEKDADDHGHKYSTRVEKLNGGYVIEIPDLIDHILQDRAEAMDTIVLVQTLKSDSLPGNLNFSFHGWSLGSDLTLRTLSQKETQAYAQFLS